jgi:hypothetical protein
MASSDVVVTFGGDTGTPEAAVIRYDRPMRSESKNPPTIASLSASGVAGVHVLCQDCRRSTALPFGRLGLPVQTLFPAIIRLRRFRCEGCGGNRAAVTPDWREYKAPGMGRR